MKRAVRLWPSKCLEVMVSCMLSVTPLCNFPHVLLVRFVLALFDLITDDIFILVRLALLETVVTLLRES